MDKAVSRIKTAICNKERITIYGDYDVDGITSVSMLVLYFRSCGVNADYYIPDRNDEGYGVNENALKSIRAGGTSLIITVDTGITAVNEAEYAKSIGLDLIVTDHHECKDVLPCCTVIVNPKRADSVYPFKNLAGAGVAFKLICALVGERNINRVIDIYSEFACLGTVADVMPLISENRAIVTLGLERLNRGSKNFGIRAITEAAGYDTSKKITAATLGFAFAPRINAAGRLGDAKRAVRMFLEDSYKRAMDIALELCKENRERQDVENEIKEQAIKIIESEYDLEKDRILVLCNEGWHHGIIGIVASRLTDKYYLPCIMISLDSDSGKGSGRSIRGFNLFCALEHCSDILEQYGGHDLAAGLTVKAEQLDEFKKRIGTYAKDNIKDEDLERIKEIDAVLFDEDISIGTAKEIELLEPYGMSNPLPLFMVKDAAIEDITGIGNDKHLKLNLRVGGKTVTALYFGMTPQKFMYAVSDRINLLCNLDVNRFRGTEKIQLIVKDIRPSGVLLSDAYKEEYECFLANKSFPLPKSAIPVRAEMGYVYTYFHKNKSFAEKKYLPSDLCRSINNTMKSKLNYAKLMLSLDIMEELGLLKVSRYGQYINVRLCENNKKVQLKSSGLWAALSY